MGAIATFNFNLWQARYPEFITVSEPLANLYFAEAGLYLNNAGAGPVDDASIQLLLLNMITAHIAKLNAKVNGVSSPDVVGRVTNAGEGSVSVTVEVDLAPGSAQWFAQTKYGFAFWQASARFRTANYLPAFPRRVNPWNLRRGW